MGRFFFLCLLCVIFGGPQSARAQETRTAPTSTISPREQEALDLLMAASRGAEKQRIALVRKLAGYRYPSIARALVGMLSQKGESPAFLKEVEWAVVAMSATALEPLTDALTGGQVTESNALLVLTRIARQEPTLLEPYLRSPRPEVGRGAVLAVASSGHPGA